MHTVRYIGYSLFLLSVFSCRQKQKTVAPVTKLLTEAVYASGTLVPEMEYKVVSSVDGFLASAQVKEGDSVRKNQLLFQLSNSNQTAQVNAAEGIVSKTKPVADPNGPAIKDLENKLASARVRLQNDQTQFNRYKNLFEQNAISASNYDKYRLQYETSQHDVQALEQQLQQQRLNAALQLQQASNQLSIAQTNRMNGNIKSYADGRVFDIYKQVGDLIAPNQPIALVGSGKMIAKLMVDQDDLQKVYVGQKILITMDAFPNKTFNATVNRIYPMLNKAEQSFRTDAVFDEPIPFSMYGLNVEANIVVKEKQQVMVIPKSALLPGDSVKVETNGAVSKVKIRKGVSDAGYVQVLGGLPNPSKVFVQP